MKEEQNFQSAFIYAAFCIFYWLSKALQFFKVREMIGLKVLWFSLQINSLQYLLRNSSMVFYGQEWRRHSYLKLLDTG